LRGSVTARMESVRDKEKTRERLPERERERERKRERASEIKKMGIRRERGRDGRED
jgi:hypothetical protein